MYEKGRIFQKTVKVIRQTLCRIQVGWADFLSQLATAKGFLVVQGATLVVHHLPIVSCAV